MTREDLADRLNHLDPGAGICFEKSDLEALFGGSSLSNEVLKVIEDFALEHRCTFLCQEHGRDLPRFEKDDVY